MGKRNGKQNEIYVAKYSYMKVVSTLVPEWQNKWQILHIGVLVINSHQCHYLRKEVAYYLAKHITDMWTMYISLKWHLTVILIGKFLSYRLYNDVAFYWQIAYN